MELERIALVGLRACGKSSVGRALAALVGAPFADLDEATSPGEPAGALLVRAGEPEFRRREAAALHALLERPGPLVLATGGGVVETPAARAALREKTRCVWLDAGVSVLRARLARDPTPRPALLGDDSIAEIEAVHARRAPLYREAAEVVVDASHGTPEEIARRVLRALTSSERAD